MKTRMLFPLFLSLILFQNVQGQDSLLRADLSPFVYHFDLKDGKLSGPGAELLKNEAMKTQYFLLGEYHGSRHISNLTSALIPILHEAGYRHFGVEVGPYSARILRELSADPDKTVERLKIFNEQYGVEDIDGDTWTAIPFFDYDEDARFLADASEKKWNFFGLDQEFWYGFIPLLDRIYNQLDATKQKELAPLHQQVRDSIMHYYKMDDLDQKPLSTALLQSQLFNSFLAKAAEDHPENLAIADALRTTTRIYNYNVTRKYLECNATRIDYMKENLYKAFQENNFDLKKDKMLLKMGSIHTAKGFSWLSLYELGNTLHELADFHQYQSVHLSFSNRYSEEDGKIVDGLDDPESYSYRYYDLLQFGHKDRWTIVDLRPLKEKIYYHRKYEMSDLMKDYFRQHDLFIIVPLEQEE